jgi:hypothetical protein
MLKAVSFPVVFSDNFIEKVGEWPVVRKYAFYNDRAIPGFVMRLYCMVVNPAL